VDINGDMRNLATYKIQNKEDALKYAYAFMKSKQLRFCSQWADRQDCRNDG
jgi:hypothetical protein